MWRSNGPARVNAPTQELKKKHPQEDLSVVLLVILPPELAPAAPLPMVTTAASPERPEVVSPENPEVPPPENPAVASPMQQFFPWCASSSVHAGAPPLATDLAGEPHTASPVEKLVAATAVSNCSRANRPLWQQRSTIVATPVFNRSKVSRYL